MKPRIWRDMLWRDVLILTAWKMIEDRTFTSDNCRLSSVLKNAKTSHEEKLFFSSSLKIHARRIFLFLLSIDFLCLLFFDIFNHWMWYRNLVFRFNWCLKKRKNFLKFDKCFRLSRFDKTRREENFFDRPMQNKRVASYWETFFLDLKHKSQLKIRLTKTIRIDVDVIFHEHF